MSGLGRGGKEPYWTQKAPDQQGRLIGLPFQEFLNLRDPVSNPGLGWNREGDLPPSLEHLEVRLQRVDAPFSLEDGVTQRSGQNARLRGGIEKETEGVTLVPTRHSPPAIPIAPLHSSSFERVSL
jgi:hypothetical protein